ncbi:MAG TPA: SGNH/GDSL hydrolase family protein [Streptosporangiaceae bacterium]|jgi:lysophospholipase L1-like esterase
MTRTVCLGDSIIRAQVSADCVKMLRDRAASVGGSHTFINAGVNGDLAYNALQRLDEVIAARPDVVTVLLGTNDANASLSETNVQMMTKMKKLEVRPTIEWYEENLRAIAERLAKETDARVALLSLPVLGQDPGTLPVLRAAAYSEVVKRTAAEFGATYLPLYETQLAHLESVGAKAGIPFQDGKKLSSRAAMQHFMLFRSFDAISRRRGLELTTDFIHQNTTGAAMIAGLIGDFVLGG